MKLLRFILITIGALMLINAAVMTLITNFNLGNILVAIAGAVPFVYGVFFKALIKLKWLTVIVTGCFFAGLSMAVFLAVYGKSDNVTFKEEAVIVLGAGVRGESVTSPLAYRLNKAVEYHVKNPDALIIVSGGQGSQEDITEALAMERYLLRCGVPQNKIIKEERSTSTYENFKYSRAILDEHFSAPYKIAFITNDFHIFRANRIAKSLDLDITHYHAKIEWYTIPANYLRECAAVIVQVIGKF